MKVAASIFSADFGTQESAQAVKDLMSAVAGHNGHPMNERVDRPARGAITRLG